MAADQQIKSITVLKQVIRADGTVEPQEVAAYIDRDPDRMAAFIRDHDVKGRVKGGTGVIDLLNSVSEEDAERICQINEAQSCA